MNSQQIAAELNNFFSGKASFLHALRALLLHKNASPELLARYLNIPPSTLTSWLSGCNLPPAKQQQEHIKVLVKALKIQESGNLIITVGSKAHQLVFTLKSFLDGGTTFPNVLQILVQTTPWSSDMFALYFNVPAVTFKEWSQGENLPSAQEQRRLVTDITVFMNINVNAIAESLQKLDSHIASPNNNTFVDAMQTLDFQEFNKEHFGKLMFGKQVTLKETSRLLSNYKRRRSLPRASRQQDFSMGAVRAVQNHILAPFERIRTIQDLQNLLSRQVVVPIAGGRT